MAVQLPALLPHDLSLLPAHILICPTLRTHWQCSVQPWQRPAGLPESM